MRGFHSDAPGPAVRPRPRHFEDRPFAPIMVQKHGGEELGAFHCTQKSNGYVIEFHFNLADIHLGRFDIKVIQQAVRTAITSAFAGHAVSGLKFPERQPYTAKFAVAPSSGSDFVDIQECVGGLGHRLDGLLQAAPKLPRANPDQQ